MAYVEVEPGVRIYVEEWGDGPPVVFVHGGAVTHEFWEHQVSGLIDRFRVVTLDLRGCGRSDRPSRGYSADVWADDLASLIEQLELDRPVVVGHAFGSHIAVRLAIRRPGTISKLVIASGAPCAFGQHDQAGGFSESMWTGLKQGIATNRPQAELDLADERYFHNEPGEGIRLWTLHMALQWSNGVYAQLFESFPSLDHRPYLDELDIPVLVAHGRHDDKNKYEGGVYLAEHLPNARLVTFEDSAHCPPLEEVVRFNDELTAFIDETAATEAATGEASAARGGA